MYGVSLGDLQSIWVGAIEFDGDGGDITIIDKFYLYGIRNLAIINGVEIFDE